jgi:hypothetical protein
MTFNIFASQLRICIEMAFGLMTKKWGILHLPLSNLLPSIKHLFCCIARLHNFCIDQRLKTGAGLDTHSLLLFTQLAYMNASAQAEHQEIVSNKYPQWSLATEEMVKLVKQQNLTCPTANRLRA